MQNKLLDEVKSQCGLKNDAALSRALEVAPPVISKIRHGTLDIGATMIVKIMRLTAMSIMEVDRINSDEKLERKP